MLARLRAELEAALALTGCTDARHASPALPEPRWGGAVSRRCARDI